MNARIPAAVAATMHCPPWCDLRPDHLDDQGTEVIVDHRHVVGTLLAAQAQFPGDARRARLLSVLVTQFAVFDRSTGVLLREPAAVRLDGANPLWLTGADAVRVAELLHLAGTILGGAQ